MINNFFLKYLCCPVCKNNLKIDKSVFYCSGCNKKYYTEQDVPIFMDSEGLSDHQKYQIKYFKRESEVRSAYKLEEWQKSYLRRFDETFKIRKNDVLVDIGTGSGYMAIEMAIRGLKVVACDLSLESLLKLNLVRKKYHLENNLLLVFCNAEELPIRSNVADYLVSNAVLEHLPKEKRAIKEIDRISKNTHTGMMITVPIKYRYLHPLFIPINYIHDKRIGHLRRYDKDEIKQKFHNWEEISCYYTGHKEKVIKIIVNSLFKFFDEGDIEREDSTREKIHKGSSNICMFFRKETSH